jgi:uncharacterized protein
MYSEPPITVRRFKDSTPTHPICWNHTIDKSFLFEAMGALTPLFEHLVLSSVMVHRQQISDPLLQQRLRLFIAQENQHRRAYLHQQQKASQPLRNIHYQHLRIMHFLSKGSSKNFRLSMSVATEHWTAILAHTLLHHSQDYFHNTAHPKAQLWIWHAIEEIEHKAVAFDLQKALNIGYLSRCSAMLLVTVLFGFFYWHHVFSLHRNTTSSSFSSLTKLLLHWIGRKGLLTRSLPRFLAFFSPSFHPWKKKDDRALLKVWLQKLQQAHPCPSTPLSTPLSKTPTASVTAL